MSAAAHGSTSPGAIGLRQEAVEQWLRTALPDAVSPLSFDLLAGGYSNLTFRVGDRRGRAWVLRRPPAGPVRAGAHSMEREWRIISALQSTPVPVPPAVAFCADPDVTGAEFYVMDHVEGVVVDSAVKAGVLSSDARRRVSSELVATLSHLHEVDPAVVGRRPGDGTSSYVSRQLELWIGQIASGGAPRTREILEVHQLLFEGMPPQRWTSLTHGDFRLGNVLVSTSGAIEAVLDWELWTTGDPLADLGWLAAWWNLDTDDGWAPSRAEGFPQAADLVADYQRLTGRDTSDVAYYVSFALWRLSCISEGVYERYAAGIMGRPPVSLDSLAARPRELAAAARAALR